MDHKNPASDSGDGVLFFLYIDETCSLHTLQVMASCVTGYPLNLGLF